MAMKRHCISSRESEKMLGFQSIPFRMFQIKILRILLLLLQKPTRSHIAHGSLMLCTKPLSISPWLFGKKKRELMEFVE